MNQDRIDHYSFRVTQANKSQLVVIVYDILLEDLMVAEEQYEKGDIESFLATIKHAQKFVKELMRTLDCKYEIGLDLMTLYLYINKMLIQAMIQRKIEPINGLHEVVMKLRTAFETISRTDHSGAVMQNTEQVYAGLTYNKHDLSEMYVDANRQIKRGFTV